MRSGKPRRKKPPTAKSSQAQEGEERLEASLNTEQQAPQQEAADSAERAKASGVQIEEGRRKPRTRRKAKDKSIIRRDGVCPGLPGALSELAVPFKFADDVLGVLDIQSDRLNAFDAEDIAALQLLSLQIAVAVRNAKIYTEVLHLKSLDR